MQRNTDFSGLIETASGLLREKEADIEKMIADLEDAYGKSNEDQGKMVQLLRGLAFSDDPKANEFMKKLDRATTEIAAEMRAIKAESTEDSKNEETLSEGLKRGLKRTLAIRLIRGSMRQLKIDVTDPVEVYYYVDKYWPDAPKDQDEIVDIITEITKKSPNSVIQALARAGLRGNKNEEALSDLDEARGRGAHGAKNKREAQWYAAFKSAVTSGDKAQSGRIDWDTAKYLMGKGENPQDAAKKYLKAMKKMESMEDNKE